MLMAGDDDEMFMTRSFNVTPKTTDQHSVVRSDKSVFYVIFIIIIIIIIGFSVYLHNSPGDITQFNNKSMQKT